jgi:phosphate transport system substrate-binding protein
MAKIGYSPLPPNLSQEMANSIGRMNGEPPEQLTRESCKNPRFGGSLGGGSVAPKDPLESVNGGGSGGTGSTGGGGRGTTGGSGGTGGAGGATGGTGDTAGGTDGGTGGATGGTTDGGVAAVGGGSGHYRAADPVKYDRPIPNPQGPAPLVLLIVVLFAPLGVALVHGRTRGSSPS